MEEYNTNTFSQVIITCEDLEAWGADFNSPSFQFFGDSDDEDV